MNFAETNSNYPFQIEIKNKASLGFQYIFFQCTHLPQTIRKGLYAKPVTRYNYHYLEQTKTLKVSFPILGCTAGRLDPTKEMNSTSQKKRMPQTAVEGRGRQINSFCE